MTAIFRPRQKWKAAWQFLAIGSFFFGVLLLSQSAILLSLPDGQASVSTLEDSPPDTSKSARRDNHAWESLPPYTIFYHIYVQHDAEQQARNIVDQQIRDLGQALSRSAIVSPQVLYYTTVGQEIDESFMDSICRGRFQSCHRLQHISSGFEEHTLQSLWEYCQEHEEHRVIYLHTKGSYHSSPGQDRWRRHMTEAVASQECIEQAATEGCDICGLLFIARPSHHFTGNIFNAKCSYIRRLISPLAFEAKMDGVLEKAQTLVKNGTLTSILFDMNLPWNSGTKRYAMEHWHGSHPSAEIICDLATNPDRRFWKSLRVEDRKDTDWSFHRFPRGSLPGLPIALEEDFSKRKKEYFLLPGLIFKWYMLYNEVPAPSSWVWKSYQDGAFWKDQVWSHGEKAVELVANGV